MNCPTLEDLPPPPPGARGWPWTEESVDVRSDAQDDARWPRISIVTPSYNQGQFIEETIRSVLLQGYPDVEYIVIDGGSTDDSAAIIEKYSRWLSYWVSEPDSGQPHAINKGLRQCTGDIIAYINSDDTYLKDTFSRVARMFRSANRPNWVVGACYVIYDRNHPQRCDLPEFTDNLDAWYGRRCGLPQPSTFLGGELVRENGLFEESLSHGFDHEYWIRLILSGNRPLLMRSAFASFKLHDAAKTWGGPTPFRLDLHRMEELHEDRLPPETRNRLRRSRAARRWETKIRDGLQLCASGRWKEGWNLIISGSFKRTLPKALISNPDIVLRVIKAAARNLPKYLRDTARRAIKRNSGLLPSEPSEFDDPLGEYDLWDHPPQLPATRHPRGFQENDEKGSA